MTTSSMVDPFIIEDQLVTGEIALEIRPGTSAADRDRALDEVLSAPLNDAAESLGAVLAAPPHRFAHPLPGKDEAGLSRFAVRGRAEGGRLVPDRSTPKSEPKSKKGDKRGKQKD